MAPLSASRSLRVEIAEGSKALAPVLSHVTVSGSSSKFWGSHCWSSSSAAAGKNKLSGLMLAGGADVSTESEARRSGFVGLFRTSNGVCLVPLVDSRGAGGSSSLEREMDGIREVMVDCETGRTDKPLAGVDDLELSVTALLVPFVINVNSAPSPPEP